MSADYQSLRTLSMSRHRSVQEDFRVTRDDDMANLLSTYTEHLSGRKNFTPKCFQLQADFCLAFGNLFERQQVSKLFDKTVRKLQASHRVMCLWVFIRCHWDAIHLQDTLGQKLLKDLRFVLMDERAVWKNSTELLARTVISAQIKGSQKAGIGLNFYFRDFHILLLRYLKPEFTTLLESMERLDA